LEGSRVVEVRPHERFRGVYLASLEDNSTSLATRSLDKGRSIYGERLIQIGSDEYRLWDPYKSKLAAAILRGLPSLPITPACRVLYLGAATGTTVSHVSDIIGSEGLLYAVEFAARPARELIANVASTRLNIYPLVADARLPQRYRSFISPVDTIYCDVAQPEQAQILADNAELFLKPGGSALLAVKARSIDSTRDPSKVFAQEAETLKSRGFRVERTIPLRPYDRAHAMLLASKAGK
jgi:fibrillarin-like pre-rRNA processing protein